MDAKTIYLYATTAVSAAAMFCTAVPAPKPGTALAKVFSVIEFLGMNFGNAKSIRKSTDDPA